MQESYMRDISDRENLNLFISHGETNLNAPERHFLCPPKFRIFLFEHPGQFFRKLDSALIINYIMAKLQEDNALIYDLHNMILDIPLYWAKDYMVKRFQPGDLTPNIDFMVEDRNLQCGLFEPKVNEEYFKIHLELKPRQDMADVERALLQAQGNLERIFDISVDPKFLLSSQGPLLGGVQSQNTGLVKWNKPSTNLIAILKFLRAEDISASRNTERYLFIISCRGFSSPNLQNSMVALANTACRLNQIACTEAFRQLYNEIEKIKNDIGRFSSEEYTNGVRRINIFTDKVESNGDDIDLNITPIDQSLSLARCVTGLPATKLMQALENQKTFQNFQLIYYIWQQSVADKKRENKNAKKLWDY